jgi:hypothetical protein
VASNHEDEVMANHKEEEDEKKMKKKIHEVGLLYIPSSLSRMVEKRKAWMQEKSLALKIIIILQ